MYNLNIKWKYRQNFGQLLVSLGLGIIVQLPAALFTYRFTFQQAIPSELLAPLAILALTSTIILGLSIAALAETWSKEREVAITDTLASSLVIIVVFNLLFLGIYPTIQELDFVDPTFRQFPPELSFFTEYLVGIVGVLVILWFYNWLRNYLKNL